MKSSFYLVSLTITLLSSALTSALPAAKPQTPTDYDFRTVYQYPPHHWIENMAVRSNGQILATDVSASQIHLVSPLSPIPSSTIIHQFPNLTSLTGIIELQPDIFYTQSALGNVYTFNFTASSSKIWKIDMRDYDTTSVAAVSEIAGIPETGLLNGMCVLSEADGTLLLADSVKGFVWRLNTHSLQYKVVVDNELLKPVQGMTPAFGVNGIHVVDGWLYFSNTNQGLLAKVKINKDGEPLGQIQVITDSVPATDDFAVDSRDGSVWLTQNVKNTLVKVSRGGFEQREGSVETVAGGPNSTELLGPVGAVFGRTKWDRDSLYVSTDGLSMDPVTKEVLTTAGKIVAVDTGREGWRDW